MLRPHSKNYQDKGAAYTRTLFERREIVCPGLEALREDWEGQRKGRNMGRERRGTESEPEWGYELHCVSLNIFPRPKSVSYACDLCI